MPDPFARPPSRNSHRRHTSINTSFDSAYTLPPPVQTFPPGFNRLPPIGSMPFSTPLDYNDIQLAPLRNIPPRSSTTPRLGAPTLGRRPSFSGGSSAFPHSDNPFGGSSLPPLPPLRSSSSGSSSADPFALPELPPLPGSSSGYSRRRADSSSMQVDSLGGGMPGYPRSIDANPGLSRRPSISSFRGGSGNTYPDLPPLPLFPTSNYDFKTSPTSPSQESRSHQSKGIRRYTKRATFSSMQIDRLEDLWDRNNYPSVEEIDECALSAGLTAKQVRTWFGNTRQARLAGTRKEARNAGIPGVAGTAGPRPFRTRDPLFSSSPSSGSSMPATPQGLYGSVGPNFGSSGGMQLDDDIFKVPRSPASRPGALGGRSRRQSFSGGRTGYSDPFAPSPSYSSSSGSPGSFDFSSPYPM